MLPKINPTETATWKKLIAHSTEMKSVNMKNLFSEDASRFQKMSITFDDILFDYSKNIITDDTKKLLFELATACELKTATEAMFNGEKINETENRAVLHTALRNCFDTPVLFEGKDIMPDIRGVLDHMKTFCAKIHSGEWKGYSGKKIRNIVNIGIGGSDLGPVMVTEALKPYWVEGIQTYFV